MRAVRTGGRTVGRLVGLNRKDGQGTESRGSDGRSIGRSCATVGRTLGRSVGHISFFSQVSPSSCADFSWSTRVDVVVSGCRDCSEPVDNDVLQRNEKFFVRHRRPAEPEVQRILGHKLLDWEHIFLISDTANLFSNMFVSLTKVLRMSSKCSTSLVRSRSLMLLISAAHAEFVSSMFLCHFSIAFIVLLCHHCFESRLSLHLLYCCQWFVCCCSAQYMVNSMQCGCCSTCRSCRWLSHSILRAPAV